MNEPDHFDRFADDLRAWMAAVAARTPPAADPFPEMALRLFELQRQAVAPWRDLCCRRGIEADSVRDWRLIPALPTRAFKEFEVTSLPAGDRVATFHSSQTTGRDFSRHFHDRRSLALYEQSALTWFRRATGWRAGELRRVIALTPAPADAPHSSLVHMFDLIRREHGDERSGFVARTDAAGGWVIELEAARAAIHDVATLGRPAALLGTAFSFVHLLEALGSEPPIRLPWESVVMETGGYKGRSRSLPRAELHAGLQRCFGLPSSAAVLGEYGMSELSSQAYDSLPGDETLISRVFRFPPWARALVVSPETGREVADGESGLLRVFDLANVRSVMAIQTEDLAVRRGSGFELLGRVAQAEPRGCSLLPVGPG